MRKILGLLALCASFVLADMRTIDVSPEVIKSGAPIVDVRTKGEWESTGVVKDSMLITFFNEQGSFDTKAFIAELNKRQISKDKELMILCQSGRRSAKVSELLSQEGYKVVNLQGGIKSLISQGYQTTPYRP